jgi:hypothetical protein
MNFGKLLAFCLLFPAFSAFSQMPSPEGGGGPGQGHMPSMGHMGFSPDQGSMENPPFILFDLPKLQKLMADININKGTAGKIVAIVRTFQGFFDERILKIQKEELNIKEALLKDKPDLAAVQAVINRKSQIFAEIEFAQIKRDLDIKSLLSPDEYDQWKSVMMNEMRKMKSGFMNMPLRGPEGKDAPPAK